MTNNNNICRVKNCQVLDDRHILVESDIVEVDNQGKEVYFLLNLDGSLPFPGTLRNCWVVLQTSCFFIVAK